MSKTSKPPQVTQRSKAVGATTKKTSASTAAPKAAAQAATKPRAATKNAAGTSKSKDDVQNPKASLTRRQNEVAPTGKPQSKPTPAVQPKSTIRAKTTTTSSTVAGANKPKVKTTSNAAVPKKKSVNQNTTSDRVHNQPLRAQHSAAQVGTLKKNSITSNTKNVAVKANPVLDTYHNVTVASPPSLRKQQVHVEKTERPADNSKATLIRKRSRTLEPDEIVVLKRESAKKRSEQEIMATADGTQQLKLPVKEAVAFEVNFAEPQPTSKPKPKEPSNVAQPLNAAAQTSAEDDQANYSDDFESYESDFETGSSCPSESTAQTEESNSESEDGSSSRSVSERKDSSVEGSDQEYAKAVADNEETEEESELMQYPITVIPQREKERKLDSGNYEMNSRKNTRVSELSTQSSQQQFDSWDTLSANTSDQLDSGISTYGTGPQPELEQVDDTVFYGGYAHFNTKPILSRRGRDLMSKIQFDTLTFTLFDMKPISYDIYMQTFGKLNTTQSTTQTQDNQISTDCQTDDCLVRTMWTQHPPQYDLQTVQNLVTGISGGPTVQNCCGEIAGAQPNTYLHAETQDELDASLEALSAFQQNDSSRSVNRQLRQLRKPIDFEKLNTFLLNSSMLMSKVLNSTRSSNNPQSLATPEFAAFSDGYIQLDTSFLNALRVVRIFANSKHNLVITVHESLPDADVYGSDFSNLLMVWSANECNKPIRLLSSWSEVCRAEICQESSDIIVCGLRDGSIAMWDLRETYSFCSKLDGHLTHFAATQSIVPTATNGDRAKKFEDLGAVLDVKSFRAPAKSVALSNSISGYKSIQFASLNETGTLVVWTLVETRPREFDATASNKSRTPPKQNSRFEYSSPWARVKLIQSAICELKDYLQIGVAKAQSQFDTTKILFEKNIYSDDVLRELNDTQSTMRLGQGLQGLRFTSIATGVEHIYVCTNRNFILICSKSLKTERFRKIAINESRFLFPTALCVLTNEDFLAVGLSNGSVMIVNCNQRKLMRNSLDQNDKDRDAAEPHLPASSDNDSEIGKSCAIQNIILNERRPPDSANNHDQSYDSRPTTAACIAMITNQKRPFELRVYDQQMLLSGSVLRKDLVQSLELSSDGWRLFALSNGIVRTYDFYLDRELETKMDEEEYKILDIAVARGSSHEQHLLLLNVYNDVEVHLLKQ